MAQQILNLGKAAAHIEPATLVPTMEFSNEHREVSDGAEMVTLDYSHLTSVLWGVCKGFQARLDKVEAWQAERGPKNP